MTKLSEGQKRAQDMLVSGLNGLVIGDINPWVDMFSEDGVMEFPYALEGMPKRLDGKDAVENHLSRLPDVFDFSGFSKPVFHFSANSESMIVEFSCQAKVVGTGRPYNQDYISVITLSDGKIMNYKDYWNPLVAVVAMGGQDALLSLSAEEA